MAYKWVWGWVAACTPAVCGVGYSAVPLTEVRNLSSSSLKRTPPFLFFSADEIAAAKRHATAPGMRAVFKRLEAKAREALGVNLEPFSTEWWQRARARKWEETYPEIYLHTCLEPSRLAAHLDPLVRYALLADDENAFAKAKNILLHLSAFSFEPEHYDVGMNYSVWSVHALRTYDALFSRLSADERRRVDDFFTRLGRAVLKNDIYWIDNNIGGGINNHLAWHKMMLGMLGLFYEEPAMVEYAMRGPRGLIELLELGLTDDGLWCEGSLVYHFAAIVPTVLFADTLRRAGHRDNLFEMTLGDGRTLRQPLDVMFETLFPNGVIPPVGDAYGMRAALADQPIYEYGWAAWGDPRYAWLLSQRKERGAESLFLPPLPADASAPPVRSRLFPEHGYAFLRTHGNAEYWNSDARCVFLTYDRAGVHSNADKLSIMLFGYGKLLLPDVEAKATVPHAFSSRVQRELNRGGLSQNTVMIDGQDQRGPGELLDLVEFRDLPAEKRVTAADRRGLLYEGVRQQRTICLTDHYVLDVFQVRCDAVRQVDWIIHVLDERAERVSGLEMKTCEPPATTGAWPWLRDFRAAVADGAWNASWRSDDVSVCLHMAGAPGTQVIECGYPATDDPKAARVPMLIVRRRAQETTFATVYTCGRTEGGPTKLAMLIDRDGRLAFEVDAGGGRGVHLVPRLR